MIYYIDSSYLAHHGIKGQKWGVRNGPPYPLGERDLSPSKAFRGHPKVLYAKTDSGVSITMAKDPESKLVQFLSHHNKRLAERIKDTGAYSIKVGKTKIGELSVMRKGNEELNGVWVEVYDAHRGKGYGTAVVKAFVDYGKREGVQNVELRGPRFLP